MLSLLAASELSLALQGGSAAASLLAGPAALGAAASPPVAPEGMTQTDGTVLETIDVRDADFIRSEIEASNEDLRLVQGGMEISPEWRTVLARESLAYGSMVNIVGAGVPHHVRGAYWIKILETCGCPPPASLDRYVELASAPPSASRTNSVSSAPTRSRRPSPGWWTTAGTRRS